MSTLSPTMFSPGTMSSPTLLSSSTKLEPGDKLSLDNDIFNLGIDMVTATTAHANMHPRPEPHFVLQMQTPGMKPPVALTPTRFASTYTLESPMLLSVSATPPSPPP